MTTNRVQYWVLREKATKRLLPLHRTAMTRVEFGHAGPPRLFTSPGAAKQALDCWRMGLWHLAGDEDGVWPEPTTWKENDEIAARRSPQSDGGGHRADAPDLGLGVVV